MDKEIKITKQNKIWAKRAFELQAKGVRTTSAMIAALNKLHPTGVAHPAALLKSAIKGNFVWEGNPDLRNDNLGMKVRTSNKYKTIADIAQDFKDKRSDLKGHPASVFFTYLKRELIKIGKAKGIDLIGKKGSTSSITQQAERGGFKWKTY